MGVKHIPNKTASILAMVILLSIIVNIAVYKHGVSDGISESDNRFSEIQREWLYKTVVASGDYFDTYNGNTTKFKGKVIAVTVRPWGTFITVYNETTNRLYEGEPIKYFKLVGE